MLGWLVGREMEKHCSRERVGSAVFSVRGVVAAWLQVSLSLDEWVAKGQLGIKGVLYTARELSSKGELVG